ncbi:putative 2-hydroxyisocaproyl-CoA dehydratase activator [Blattamonas nauphoetae]|uniref:N-acetyl-D-glucosamine kinase n=1 Tax=Blattamonas nauphoetae TaxID=2049346 RepID=A0ABQ9YFM9_9EUKA|nr:putative 2-hydroxyisocaproyl-CoA dehydratase activator [Blattamonas nauphoetae]
MTETAASSSYELSVGLDIGSTTVKLVILDKDNNLIYKRYERHLADIRLAISKLFADANRFIFSDGQSNSKNSNDPDSEDRSTSESDDAWNHNEKPTKTYSRHITLGISGSGGFGVAKALGVPFSQEVLSCTKAIKVLLDHVDVAIELGGEDGKITYFGKNGETEQRMNGMCAGGTGAFIDQMVSLLRLESEGGALKLNELAKSHKTVYPIASRCGVFAKTDIQSLLNDGASKEDICESVLNAVVMQTIAGLACGRPIKGRVAYLGGPLTFLSELRKSFTNELKLDAEKDIVFPENSLYYVAIGAALIGRETGTEELDARAAGKVFTFVPSTKPEDTAETYRMTSNDKKDETDNPTILNPISAHAQEEESSGCGCQNEPCQSDSCGCQNTNTTPSPSPVVKAADGSFHVSDPAALNLTHLKNWEHVYNRIQDRFVLPPDNVRLPPLFANEEEYNEFKQRHDKCKVPRMTPVEYLSKHNILVNVPDNSPDSADQKTPKFITRKVAPVFVGIDVGSTTTKVVVVSQSSHLLWTHYGSNQGQPLVSCIQALNDMYTELHQAEDAVAKTMREAGQTDESQFPLFFICSSGVTGYGESLIKAGLEVDIGEVETVAHFRAARFFVPKVDFLLDIGGQDMKCLFVKNQMIDRIVLNEACSSGCGSFLENFAQSMKMGVAEFAKLGLESVAPVDLGSRCTVFMNSRVKQVQKEGATLPDISAGLALSVVKNSLYKVVRIRNTSELGNNVVVQGGTFFNDAVLRSFESIVSKKVVRPDIAGLMGAYGMALIGRDRFHSNVKDYTAQMQEYLSDDARQHQVYLRSNIFTQERLSSFTSQVSTRRCGACTNNCLLTVNTFNDGRRHITGNRCERGAGKQGQQMFAGLKISEIPNMHKWKNDRLWSQKYYVPLAPEKATRGTIGIPRLLAQFDEFPFWFTLFTKLGCRVVFSRVSNNGIYKDGADTIASDTMCYPAKLIHGHVIDLMKNKHVTRVFYPGVIFTKSDDEDATNCSHCPIVSLYPETLPKNLDFPPDVTCMNPFLPLFSEKDMVERVIEHIVPILNQPYTNPTTYPFPETDPQSKMTYSKPPPVTKSEVKAALNEAYAAWYKFRDDVVVEGKRIVHFLDDHPGLYGIVLGGRPYHVDPEISHGMADLLTGLGCVVLTEDAVAPLGKKLLKRPMRVLDPVFFHTRLYHSAAFVANHPSDKLQYIQLVSFGCGQDAVTTDEVSEILLAHGKPYTQIKIDEISNLGAAKIRVRSLFAAIEEKIALEKRKGTRPAIKPTVTHITPSKPSTTPVTPNAVTPVPTSKMALPASILTAHSPSHDTPLYSSPSPAFPFTPVTIEVGPNATPDPAPSPFLNEFPAYTTRDSELTMHRKILAADFKPNLTPKEQQELIKIIAKEEQEEKQRTTKIYQESDKLQREEKAKLLKQLDAEKKQMDRLKAAAEKNAPKKTEKELLAETNANASVPVSDPNAPPANPLKMTSFSGYSQPTAAFSSDIEDLDECSTERCQTCFVSESCPSSATLTGGTTEPVERTVDGPDSITSKFPTAEQVSSAIVHENQPSGPYGYPGSGSEVFITPLFSKSMIKTHTIICPTMSPYSNPFILSVLRRRGYTIFIPEASPPDWLPPGNKEVLYRYCMPIGTSAEVYETSLSMLHNDLCIPAHLFLGVFLRSLFPPDHPPLFDASRSALILTQTGSACRAPNYLSCLRRALRDQGHPEVPVIPLTTVGKFDAKHPGFPMNVSIYRECVYIFVLGDVLQRCLLRTRPYELEKGAANRMCLKYMEEGYEMFQHEYDLDTFTALINKLVHDFDTLPFVEGMERKPRVGIVGEIGVQLRPSLNNFLADHLESQGGEAVCLGMIDFIGYCALDDISMHDLLRKSLPGFMVSKFALWYINRVLEPVRTAFSNSKRFDHWSTADELVEMVKPHCSPLMCWGEGWLLVAEMVEMITQMDCPNILLLQPWGCLPNHITGRGFLKSLRNEFDGVNIVPIDFDTSASEVNQVNRITLMLSVARDRIKSQKEQGLPVNMADGKIVTGQKH